MNIERDIFPNRQSTSISKPSSALPVFDQSSVTLTTEIAAAGTDFTIPAGSANATVKFQLPIFPVLGNFGRTGSFGNSSLVFTGALATTLTTEVAFISDAQNLGGDASGVAAGSYMVDYETGWVYGKRVDTGTTGTATYNYLAKSSSGGGGGGNVNITQVRTTTVTSGQTTPGAVTNGELNVLADAIYNTSAPAPTNGQRVNLQADSEGKLLVNVNNKTPKFVTGTISATTDVITAVATKRLKITSIALFTSVTTANTVTLQDNATTAIYTVPLQAITGTVMGANLATPAPSFLCATAAGNKLTLNLSAATAVTYNISYFDNDAI